MRRPDLMREGTLPAAVIAAAVIAFVAYLSFQGSSHAVDYAVTSSRVAVVGATDDLLLDRWRRRLPDGGQAVVVDVAWQAGENLGAGSYAVLTTVPPGWRRLGCVPECQWSSEEGLRQFGRRLPRRPFPLAATFDADETGHVRVAFRPPRGSRPTAPPGFAPVAWLVQTNGDDVLGSQQVPTG